MNDPLGHGGRRYIKYSDQTIQQVMALHGKISACKAATLTGVSRRYISNLWRKEFRVSSTAKT